MPVCIQVSKQHFLQQNRTAFNTPDIWCMIFPFRHAKPVLLIKPGTQSSAALPSFLALLVLEANRKKLALLLLEMLSPVTDHEAQAADG